MTELYLAPWRWVLDPDNGDRWEAPLPGSVGCLDLRSVPQFSSLGGTPGPGIFSYPGPVVIPGALQLGNDLAGSLSNPVVKASAATPTPVVADKAPLAVATTAAKRWKTQIIR